MEIAASPPISPPATPLAQIKERIRHTARIAKRAPEAITLVAISKTHGPEAIRLLLDQGHRVFGENRVQEAAAKWPELREQYADVELHLVGQLQSNKADDAVGLFDCIHSLDRSSLVVALGKAMTKAGRKLPCFLQVNIGEEPQKGGCAIGDIAPLLQQAEHAGVPVIGLMAVPPLDVEPAPYFALLDKLAAEHGLACLSMGMSGDFETAVMLGATHVRVGSALFGQRD